LHSRRPFDKLYGSHSLNNSIFIPRRKSANKHKVSQAIAETELVDEQIMTTYRIDTSQQIAKNLPQLVMSTKATAVPNLEQVHPWASGAK